MSETVEKPFPGIWAAIGWVALFFILQIIAGIAALTIAVALDSAGAAGADLGNIAERMKNISFIAVPTIWSLVASSLLTLALLWLYLRKDGRVQILGLDRWSALPFKQTVGACAGVMLAVFAFDYVYQTYVFPDIEMQAEMRRLFAALPQNLPYKILLFVTAAIIAPALEELVFRGLLQRSLANRLPARAAIIIASLVFAAMHVDRFAFPALFFAGAAFGLLYHLTGSLRVSIALHIVNNSLAMLLPG